MAAVMEMDPHRKWERLMWAESSVGGMFRVVPWAIGCFLSCALLAMVSMTTSIVAR